MSLSTSSISTLANGFESISSTPYCLCFNFAVSWLFFVYFYFLQSRKDVEGSLFVVKRNTQPRFQFIVMNRRNTGWDFIFFFVLNFYSMLDWLIRFFFFLVKWQIIWWKIYWGILSTKFKFLICYIEMVHKKLTAFGFIIRASVKRLPIFLPGKIWIFCCYLFSIKKLFSF